jgi:preprotein translocase subunit SecD
MKRFFRVFSGLLLIFIAVAGFAQQTPVAQKAADNFSLPNGFYLIQEEHTDASALQKPADDETIVTYTLDHLGVYDQPPRHYRVKVKPDVPFSPDAKAEVGDKNEGKTTLNIALGEGNASEFQKFTAANIDRAVAVIIAGKVVTAHKIRSEIVGGKIQITRCGDDACEQLYLWLKDSVAK